MNFRTDLALERREYCKEKDIDGVIFTTRSSKSINITDVEITNENGEKLLLKPTGKYITLEYEKLFHKSSLFDTVIEVLSEEIKKLIPKNGTVLVAGLGNDEITPDALGPLCLSQILSTRHLTKELKKTIGLENLRGVCGIVPGVLGKTGIETTEIIAGVAEKIKPECIIVIDALASRNVSRLGTTVQLCDSGIEPGSGVGNHRKAISKAVFGVPVIAIGVPTVVDGATMTIDILEKSGIENIDSDIKKKIAMQGKMMVTPKAIDNLIENCAYIVAMAINKALQPDLSIDEIRQLVG